MNKIYKAKKIYILSLAKVTEVEESTLFKAGYTKQAQIKSYYLAKLIKVKRVYLRETSFYKLIRTGEIVHNNNNLSQTGDMLVVDKTALNMCLERPITFVDKKSLLKFEDAINNELNQEDDIKDEEKTTKVDESERSK